MYFRNKENQVVPRFSKLEVLYLDNNNLSDLSTFASLAALPQLQELNLDKNGIEVIPHLKVRLCKKLWLVFCCYLLFIDFMQNHERCIFI